MALPSNPTNGQISGKFKYNSTISGWEKNVISANSSGNVGIGTSSPSYSLDIESSSGNAYFRRKASNAGASSGLILETSSGSKGVLRDDGVNLILETSLGENQILLNRAPSNLVIGSTIDNGAKLQVNGEISVGTEPNVRWFQLKYNHLGGSHIPIGMIADNGTTGARSFSIWTNGYGVNGGNGSSAGYIYEFDGKNTILNRNSGLVQIGSHIQIGSISNDHYGYGGGFVNLIGDNHAGFVLGSNLSLKDKILYNPSSHTTLNGVGIHFPGNGSTDQGSIKFYTRNPGSVTAGATYSQSPSLIINKDGYVSASVGFKGGLFGSDNSYNGALLHSGVGRSDDSNGDTWIYADDLGNSAYKWGIKHNQTSNLLEFWGDNVVKASVNLPNGTITSITKNFDIKDPRYSDESKRLIHSVLEGPEIAVFYRGEGKTEEDGSAEITLPDYFCSLVNESTSTIQITPINQSGTFCVSRVMGGKFFVSGTIKEFFWEVKAEREDVEKLTVEKEQ